MCYEFFIASRWRNKDDVESLAAALRAQKHEVYSFLDCDGNLATGTSIDDEVDAFHDALMGWEDDPLVNRIFACELSGITGSDALILLEPAGHSSLAEAGIAFGMKKPVILVGRVARPEIAYRMCHFHYPSVETFLAGLAEVLEKVTPENP